MTIDLEALGREIAARLDDDALLDCADVAAMLKYEPRYVAEVLAKQAGFPKAVRLPGRGGAPGHPRYIKRDVIAFVRQCKPLDASRGGRQRKAV